MHNYIVPNKYKFETRMGNWSEEWELEETKYLYIHIIAYRMKDYLKTKASGDLQSIIKDQK